MLMSVTGLRGILNQYKLNNCIQQQLILREFMFNREVLDGCYFLNQKFILPEKDTNFCRITRMVHRNTDVFYYHSNQFTGICFNQNSNQNQIKHMKIYLTQSQLFKIDEKTKLWHTIPLFDHNSIDVTKIYDKSMITKIMLMVK